MIRYVFATFDSAAASFHKETFNADHVGIAIRGMSDLVNDPNKGSDQARHPEHFSLYELATYDTDSGAIDRHPQPKLVVQLSSLVKVTE